MTALTTESKPIRYKYLKYLPKPVYLDPALYDLVDDALFFKKDHRVPLIMLTQFGIFPPKGHYNRKPEKDLRFLEGLEHEIVGFFRRTYLSRHEKKGIVLKRVDKHLLKTLRKHLHNIQLF